jgi:hypothetical protein
MSIVLRSGKEKTDLVPKKRHYRSRKEQEEQQICQYNPQKNISLAHLRKISNIVQIRTRFKNLTSKYLEKAILTNNPLITDLINDYTAYRPNLINKEKHINTILCDHFETINEIKESINDDINDSTLEQTQ